MAILFGGGGGPNSWPLFCSGEGFVELAARRLDCEEVDD